MAIITDSSNYVETSPNKPSVISPNFLIASHFRAQLSSNSLLLPLKNDKSIHLVEHLSSVNNLHEIQNPISDPLHNFSELPINYNDYTSTKLLLH